MLIACLLAAPDARAALVRVPQQFTGIQAAITAAQSGDTVLIAPGTYAGALTIGGKVLTLASHFILTADTSIVSQTVINTGNPILRIQSSASGTAVRGLTFRGSGYHIENRARGVAVEDSRFYGGGDQMSFEAGGGSVRRCWFENAGDDGIDADENSDAVIEDNVILNARDDGIEVRLHNFTGPARIIVIVRNVIVGAREDGIQLIDYDGASDRFFRIDGNVIANSAKAGLGCMTNGNTTENFAGSPMVEPCEVVGNTFLNNPYALTGGDNMLVLNNIFAGSTQIAVKRVAGRSLVAYNDFWNNATNYSISNVDVPTNLYVDPRLDAGHGLLDGSPCIDAGAPFILWNGSPVVSRPYEGTAPDLGAHETTYIPVLSAEASSRVSGLAISGVRPNPARGGFAVAFTLPDAAPARLELWDLAGRRVLTRELAGLGRGSHIVNLAEARALPAGVYLVYLTQGGRSRTTRVVVVR